jgi:hypothetical protein
MSDQRVLTGVDLVEVQHVLVGRVGAELVDQRALFALDGSECLLNDRHGLITLARLDVQLHPHSDLAHVCSSRSQTAVGGADRAPYQRAGEASEAEAAEHLDR